MSSTKYKIESQLGSGAYGTVYSADDNGTKVALKVFNKEVGNSNKTHTKPNNGCECLNEIDIMSKLRHRNVVKLIDFYFNEHKQLSLVIPLAMCDLRNLITNQKTLGLDLENKIKIMYDVANGMSFIHSNGILHLDLKPNNILIYPDPEFKYRAVIADLGLAIYVNNKYIEGKKSNLDRTYNRELVTVSYRAPELFKEHPNYKALNSIRYNQMADVWAYGVIFLRFFNNYKNLYNNEDESGKVFNLINDMFSPRHIEYTLERNLAHIPRLIRARIVVLISKLLSLEYRNRLPFDSIVKQSVFIIQNINNFSDSSDSDNDIDLGLLNRSIVERLRNNFEIVGNSEVKITNSFKQKRETYRIVIVNPLQIEHLFVGDKFLNHEIPLLYELYLNYDILFRIAVMIGISVDTLFLSIDMYMRIYHKISNNVDKFKYLVTCLWMASKLNEAMYISVNRLVEITGRYVLVPDFVNNERYIMSWLGGITYNKNPFNNHRCRHAKYKNFDFIRQPFYYQKLDKDPGLLDEPECEKCILDPNPSHNLPFKLFFLKTSYYRYLESVEKYKRDDWYNTRYCKLATIKALIKLPYKHPKHITDASGVLYNHIRPVLELIFYENNLKYFNN